MHNPNNSNQLSKTITALKTISERLEAWAEYHENRVRRLADNEIEADRNAAQNYRNLMKIAHEAINGEA